MLLISSADGKRYFPTFLAGVLVVSGFACLPADVDFFDVRWKTA